LIILGEHVNDNDNSCLNNSIYYFIWMESCRDEVAR